MSIFPHINGRGLFEWATMATGDTLPKCTGCLVLHLPGAASTSFLSQRPDLNLFAYQKPGWAGSLIDEQLSVSGLAFRRAGVFETETGRFTQVDPIGTGGGLNVYGYAGGDPINHIDPFGLIFDEEDVGYSNRGPCSVFAECGGGTFHYGPLGGGGAGDPIDWWEPIKKQFNVDAYIGFAGVDGHPGKTGGCKSKLNAHIFQNAESNGQKVLYSLELTRLPIPSNDAQTKTYGVKIVLNVNGLPLATSAFAGIDWLNCRTGALSAFSGGGGIY